MIYRSNLVAPPLDSYFKLKVEPRPWSLGHSIPSDPDFEPDCGFFSHDEAAILYTIAGLNRGRWLDIGSRTGWTTAHIAMAGCNVVGVDQGYQGLDETLIERALQNLVGTDLAQKVSIELFPATAAFAIEHYSKIGYKFRGFCIDGNHDAPEPLNDALGCDKLTNGAAVMVFHDFRGRPIRQAVKALQELGYKARVYWTPAVMAVCWKDSGRDHNIIPTHEPDRGINWPGVALASEIPFDFDLSLCA